MAPINQILTVGTSRSKVLSGAEPASCCIRNLGANVVYLDSMTDVTANSFPLFPGDVAQWKQSKPCYCLSPSGNQVLAVSDSLDNTLGLGKVTATLDPATSVGITGVDTSAGSIPVVGAVDVSNTVNVGITGDANTVSLVTGTNVGITGTPSVSVSGTPNVAVTNSPTVGISGTANTVGLTSGTNVGITGTPSVGIASGLPDVTISGTLRAAGDTVGWLALGGRSGAAFVASPDAAFNGTIAADLSIDGGSTVLTANYYGPTSLAVFQSSVLTPSAGVSRIIIVPPGTTHVRVRCLAWTSGTCPVNLTTTDGDANHPIVVNTPTVGISGTANTVGLSSGTNVGISGTPNVGIASGPPSQVSTVTLNANGASRTLSLSGYMGAAFSIAAGTFVGSVQALISSDGGVNYTPTQMYDLQTYQIVGTTLTFGSSPNPLTLRGIVIPAGATHVVLYCSAYTSGSAVGTLSTTTGNPAPIIANTPGVVGARVSQTVLSGATANVVSVATNNSTTVLTTTVIPSSSTQSIELHNCVFTTTGAGNTGPNTGKLIRSDTGANLAIPQSVPVAGTVSQAKDFQGALLPPGVSVQSVATTPAFGSSSTVSVDINYNLVG